MNLDIEVFSEALSIFANFRSVKNCQPKTFKSNFLFNHIHTSFLFFTPQRWQLDLS